MEIVQRILGKIIGEQVSVEEMEIISGGLSDVCAERGLAHTWTGGQYQVGELTCD